MSSVCPNCGSGMIEDDTLEPFCPLATLSPWACQRIGSLREELAAARDAERDRIADWLRTCNPSKTAPHLAGCFGSADKLANAIRNNEHRKGDQ